MDTGEKHHYMLEDVQSKIALLEKAIDEVGSVKKSLKTTAADVKAQIRDNISRHLEALRNRETWLLSQVEVVQHGKEDLLRHQHAELNQTLGSLKNMLDLLQQKGDKLTEVEHLEEQLMQAIQAVEQLSLAPVENSWIGFKALNLELLEHIRRFGMVVADDALEASYQGGQAEAIQGVKRKYFSPTGPSSDWLLKSGHLHRSVSMPGALSSSGDESSAVANWLARCHISDPKPLNQHETASWLMSPKVFKEALNANPDVVFGYIKELKASATGLWVKKMPAPAEPLKPTVLSETYTKIAALGPEHWLAYKQRRSDLRSMAEILQELHGICNNDPDMWLKRGMEQAPQEVDSALGKAYDRIAATGPEKWLKRGSAKSPGDADSTPSSAEKWLRPKPNCDKTIACADFECWSGSSITAISDGDSIMDTEESLSDAGWLSIKKEDVISIENLDSIFQLRKKKPPTSEKTWLSDTASRPVTTTGDQCGIKAYHNSLKATPDDVWLMASTPSPIAIQDVSGFKRYLESLPSDYTKWIAPAKPKSDICQLLARSSIDRCKEYPPSCSKDLFGVFRDKESAIDNWLIKSTTA